MQTECEIGMEEERSPLLWAPPRPGLFIGSAGHITHRGKGLIFPFALAYYLGVLWGVEGSACITLDNYSLTISPGQACLINNGSHYRVESMSDRAEFIYISLDGEASGKVLDGYDLWEGIFRSGPAPLSQVKTIMSRLCLTQSTQVKVTLVEGLDLIKAIQIVHHRTTPNKMVFESKILIHRCWPDPQFNVNAVYDRLNANKSSLAAKFKHSTGKTILEYLHDIRLYATMGLLRDKDQPISSIAYECGFSDPSYFARFFKKKTGMSPQSYRDNAHQPLLSPLEQKSPK